MALIKYSVYGSIEGKLVVYFHGAPGSSAEAVVLDEGAKLHGLKVICFDRFFLDCGADREAYCRRLASEVLKLLDDEATVNIVGFSIGAFVALEVSAHLGTRVESIHLISAAAPLNSGDYLDQMAGGFVFKLADRRPTLFFLLTQYQKFLSRFAPKALFKILFASAEGDDVGLITNASFRKFLLPILRTCFRDGSAGYMRDVQAYVRWEGDLRWCNAKTTNWHGTSDNWSPFEMAVALQRSIPGAGELVSLEACSHYSSLIEAAPRVMERISCD